MSLDDIRHKIRDLVREFHAQSVAKRPDFVPGESRVRYAGRVFDSEELEAAVAASLDFWLTAGRFSEDFAGALADYFGLADAVLVNSGSSANLCAVSALTSPKLDDRRLKPGDEVITAACGFPSTVAPIVQNGLIPVFVDVDPETYNITEDGVAAAVGPRTRAIIAAHTLGNPFPVEPIAALARERGLWLIEDNCDALGSLYNGRLSGTFGHAATCSFYPAHHITTGEGGAVVTGDEDLARIVRSFRDWGRDCYCEGGENNTCGRRFSQQIGRLPYGYDHKYVYSHIGYNLKMTDIQAAIGCAQLRKLPEFIAARKRNHRMLLEGLQRHGERLRLPVATPGSDPSWFAFVVTVAGNAGFSRSELTRFLEERHIETRNLFSGNLLRHPAFMDVPCRISGSLSVSDDITESSFFLGVYPGLTQTQIEYVISTVDLFMKGR